MKKSIIILINLFFVAEIFAQKPFTIFLSPDVCADYAWVINSEQVHEYSAELIRTVLDEMNKTDQLSYEERFRYTSTVTNEVFFFLEKYPERKDELFSRIRVGRFMISPFLCNVSWGFCSSETFLRTLYPAKLLSHEVGVPLSWVVNSELPSFPQGVVSLLAGSNINWCCKSYLDYDASFKNIDVPPVFRLYGADSSFINVAMDNFANGKFSYAQGAGILKIPPYNKDTTTIDDLWIPHYSKLPDYPLNAALAEGLFYDLVGNSAEKVEKVVPKISELNSSANGKYKIISSTFSMYADYVDSVENIQPFMKDFYGGFGITWEAWPVSMASLVGKFRLAEKKFYAIETLMALSGVSFHDNKSILETYRKAQWNLAMLTDHAWNGANPENKKENYSIRTDLLHNLDSLSSILFAETLNKDGFKEDSQTVSIFNGSGSAYLSNYPFTYGGKQYLLNDTLPALSSKSYDIDQLNSKYLVSEKPINKNRIELKSYTIDLKDDGTVTNIKSKHYEIDLTDIIKLSYKFSDSSYVDSPVFVGSRETANSILLKSKNEIGPLNCRLNLRLYDNSDKVDIDITVNRNYHENPEELYAVFNLPLKDNTLHIATIGSVIKPYLQPKGDFLPGADTSKNVVQNFVAAENEDYTATIVPIEAFLLKTDKPMLTFELLGNNMNPKEAIVDQGGDSVFHFRFSLKLSNKYSQADSYSFSQTVQTEPLLIKGQIKNQLQKIVSPLEADQFHFMCIKPAEPELGSGIIMKMQNVDDKVQSVNFNVKGYSKATICDLLETDKSELKLGNSLQIKVRKNGFLCLRLSN